MWANEEYIVLLDTALYLRSSVFFLQQDSFMTLLFSVVDYKRGQKCNSMLPGQKLQELQTSLGT